MRGGYFTAAVLAWLPSAGAVRRKGAHDYDPSNAVYGDCALMGPLGSHYLAKSRPPGFPFEFPPIYPESTDRYLIFPAPDTLADYRASMRRCQVYRGSLARIETPVELGILACAIGTPSFIGGWNTSESGKVEDANNQCMVLHPGGVLSISAGNCQGSYGSICKIPKSPPLEGFQV